MSSTPNAPTSFPWLTRKILTAAQFDARYAALPDSDAQLLVETAIETGLRWGELTELRATDIDFATGVLTVSRAVIAVSRKHHPAGRAWDNCLNSPSPPVTGRRGAAQHNQGEPRQRGAGRETQERAGDLPPGRNAGAGPGPLRPADRMCRRGARLRAQARTRRRSHGRGWAGARREARRGLTNDGQALDLIRLTGAPASC